jgi:hypothetical protein
LKRFRAGGMASAGGASSRAGPGTVGCRRCVIPSARKTWQQIRRQTLANNLKQTIRWQNES